MKNKKCKLCSAENKSFKIYSDSVCWVEKSTKDSIIATIVYNLHDTPSQRDIQHMWAITQKIYPNKVWSNRENKYGHWHEYILK